MSPVDEAMGLFCDGCGKPFHYSCADKTGKPSAPVVKALDLSRVAVFCDICLDARKGPRKSTASLLGAPREEAIGLIKQAVSELFTESIVPAKIICGKSYAQVASKNSPKPPSIAAAFASVVEQKNEKELRLRSVVIDGVPFVEGESDEEKLQDLLHHCGIASFVRIQSVYRMGKQAMLQSPKFTPKIKVVLCNRSMQQALLAKDVRAKLKERNAPRCFRDAYINPPRRRQVWEGYPQTQVTKYLGSPAGGGGLVFEVGYKFATLKRM